MRFLVTALLLLCSLWSQGALAESRLELVLLDNGSPMSGVTLEVSGEQLGVTDADGALSVTVAEGEQQLRLLRDGVELGQLSVHVDKDQPVLVIGAVPDGGGALTFDVEGAGDGATPLADDIERAVGQLSGQVLSAETGEPVAGVQLYLSGRQERITTDSKGRFQAGVPAGEYQLSAVHPDFSTQTLDAVQVSANQNNSLTLEISPAGLKLEDFTVSAPHVEGGLASAIAQQRDTSSVSEVLGAEQMSRSGDSNAASALKRVTGLTIENGKYVVVRGQPSRYTETLWNGSPLPSPDPIRRIVPLDLFPTGVLSSISVEKSYDAAFPGSFGGGLVRLETAGIPEERFAKISLSGGINTETTGKQGLDYEGGGSDILGEDDGTRDMPPALEDGLCCAALEQAGKGFTNIWALEEQTLGPDMGIGVTAGTRTPGLGGELGARVSFKWGQSFDRRETLKRDYFLTGGVNHDQVEERTDMNIDLGGMLVLAGEWDNHSLTSNTFMVRKTTKRSQLTEGWDRTSNDNFIRDYLLEWYQRDLFAQQFLGAHDFGWVEVNWRGMLAVSERSVPDQRSYSYLRRTDGSFGFFNQAKAYRSFSDSEDQISGFGADLKFPLLDTNDWKLNLHTGLDTYIQERESLKRIFTFTIPLSAGVDTTQSPEILLDPAKLGSGELNIQDDTLTNDHYLGDAEVTGQYLKLDMDWHERLRLTLGARQEQAIYEARTFVFAGSAGGQQVSSGFDETDVLPSAALTWRFLKNHQLRLSAATSLSRPNITEISPAPYADPDTGDEYQSNPDLKPAKIDSLDARWEWYPSGRESVTFGVFSKDYTDAIEQSIEGRGDRFVFKMQNARSATVDGYEIAGRTSLDRLTGLLGFDVSDNFYVSANAAFIDSQVTLARQDLATSAERPLQGQADVMYNAQFGYEGERHKANLSFNLVGERLHLAGAEGQADVYQQPVSKLDFNYGYAIGEHFGFGFSAGNLLDPKIEQTQDGRIFRSTRKGIDLGASLSWEF